MGKVSKDQHLNIILVLTRLENDPVLLAFIKKVSETFDFIAINEYFDESIILLGEILCWPLEQLAYFSINQRHNQKSKTELANFEALKHMVGAGFL